MKNKPYIFNKGFQILVLFLIPWNYSLAQCICTNCPQSLPDNTNQDFYMNVDDSGVGDCDLSTNPLLGVNLNFTHEYLGDLTISLTSPSGQTIRLVGLEGYHGDTHYMCGLLNQFECADTFQINFITTGAIPFDSQALTLSATANNTGTFTPNDGNSLASFSGSACGTWRINVNDNQAFDVGEFLDFSLVFTENSGIDCNSASPLPIELTNFKVERINHQVALTWETASETNNRHFSIQRAEDGFSFFNIGQVQGAGTTFEKQNYAFIDEHASIKPAYYRLKQIDFDGKTTYSQIRFLEGKLQEPILVYPNPTKETASVAIHSWDYAQTPIQIRNALGKSVFNSILALEPGANFLELNLKHLSSGVYYINAQGTTYKFYKL